MSSRTPRCLPPASIASRSSIETAVSHAQAHLARNQAPMNTHVALMRNGLSICLGFCACTLAFAQPRIFSLAPGSGPVGTLVTIHGTNFSSVISDNVVQFGEVSALVTTATSNSLVAVVPIGTSYRPVTLTINGLTTQSPESFLLTFAGSNAFDRTMFSAPLRESIVDWAKSLIITDLNGNGLVDVLAVRGNYYSAFVDIPRQGVLLTNSLGVQYIGLLAGVPPAG